MPTEDTVEIKIEGNEILEAMAKNQAKSVEIKVSAEKATTDAINNQKEWVIDRLEAHTKRVSNGLFVTLVVATIIIGIAATVIIQSN
jgi:hypothetical protein